MNMLTVKAQNDCLTMSSKKTQQAVYIHFISVRGATFYFNSLTAKPANQMKQESDFNSCYKKQQKINNQKGIALVCRCRFANGACCHLNACS